MYHVIGTVISALTLYLISFIFYRTGYYTLHVHRRFWNSLLAIAFLFTALSGVFTALQINYKWNVPFVKSLLKWHVEFGIGMAITGIFHLIWHLSYFGKIFRSSGITTRKEIPKRITASEISINLFVVGFVSSSVQVLLIREMMNISGGYELNTGTFLGSWLTGSALGALMAGKSSLSNRERINYIFSLSPLVSLILLFSITRLFVTAGETPSFLESIVFTFIVLAPFCITSGFTFIKLISIARSGNDFVPGKSFSLETTGGIAAGLVISVITAGLMNTYQLLLLVILLAVSYAFLNSFKGNSLYRESVRIILFLLSVAIIIFNPDILFRQVLLPGIKVTGTEDTPYGNITTGTYEEEKSLYYNQRLLVYEDDVIEREENIHYPLLQRESPEKVIIISGSLTSHLPEIMKYGVKKVIYIERDPALAESVMSHKEILPAELVVSKDDAFRYIKHSEEFVDAVILLIPPPSTLLLSKYYTVEFFNEVRKRLKPGGIFVCSTGPGDTYFNQESINLHSSVYNSLVNIFRYVRPVVGNKLYFIASDQELSLSFCHLTDLRQIDNLYVNSDFLADDLIADKSEKIDSLLNRDIAMNRFAFPVACFYFQSYNFSKDLDEKIPSIAILVLLFALPATTIRRRNFVMYLSASALAGFEIITLFTLQLVMGNMYQLTGLVIAGLMTGLAIGAGKRSRFLNKVPAGIACIILTVYYLLTALLFDTVLASGGGFMSGIILFLLVVVPGILTGHIFYALTVSADTRYPPSAVYSADLTGSALGFIIMSGIAVPLFGIKGSLLLLSALVLAGFLFGTIGNKY